MKKQIRKLSLNKRTISNLTTTEMSKLVGGNPHQGPTKKCTYNTGCYRDSCHGGSNCKCF